MEKKVIPREQSQHLKKWDLASFGAVKKKHPLGISADSESAQIEESSDSAESEIAEESPAISIAQIALPTAEELENLHDSAFKEGHDAGFSTGYNEGLEKGYAAGFKEGEEKGKSQGYDAGLESGKSEGFKEGKDLGLSEGKSEGYKSGEEELAQELAALKTFSDNFRESLKGLEKNIAQDVLKLSIAIAQAVLHKELSLPESHLTPILQDALSALPNNASKIVVRLNPADRAFLKDEDFPPNIFDFVEDKAITRGGCQIDLGESSLDARIENRWQRALFPLGDNTPWSNQTPFTAANQSVVSENPALSSYLEKNLLAKNPNKPSDLDDHLALAVENPALLTKEEAPPPQTEFEKNSALTAENPQTPEVEKSFAENTTEKNETQKTDNPSQDTLDIEIALPDDL